MPNREEQLEDLQVVYFDLVISLKNIVCPHRNTFKDVTEFDVMTIREKIDVLLKRLDSERVVLLNVPREEQKHVRNMPLGSRSSRIQGEHVYVFCSYNSEGQLTYLSARNTINENAQQTLSFDLITAERRVNYIRRYCPAAPTINEKRDRLIGHSLSALSACLNSHISLKGERLLDLAAFDELLCQWCDRYGQYQLIDVIIGKTQDNEVACTFYTQYPAIFDSGLFFEQFYNGVKILNSKVENGSQGIRLKIDPVSLPAECKILYLNQDARELILKAQMVDIPRQDKHMYDIERYTLQQMQRDITNRSMPLGTAACSLFAVTAIPAIMYGVGTCWRSLNSKY